ncbi:MAG: hypothetical protein DMF26_19020 [Verrucomicrobia bacterium]|nr:MAG: hypothetical protein DMF26_19020 [Verrucomicrobiota bacterium]
MGCAILDFCFDGEKALRTDEAGLTDFAAFTIAFVQWDDESVPVRAAGDLAQAIKINQLPLSPKRELTTARR